MFAAFLVRPRNLVIVELEVPVVQQCHQHLQTVELFGVEERVDLPFPQPFFFIARVPQFEPHIPGLEPSPPVYVNTFYEIVLVDVIADCPDDASGGSLGLCLGPEFDYPFFSGAVLDIHLLGGAALVASHEGEFSGKVRGAFLAALPEKQVAMGDVAGVFPQDRVAFDLVGVQDFLLVLLVRFVAAIIGLILLFLLVLFRGLARRRRVLRARGETRSEGRTGQHYQGCNDQP